MIHPVKIYEDGEVVVVKGYSIDEVKEIILDILRRRGGGIRYSELVRFMKKTGVCGEKTLNKALRSLTDAGIVYVDWCKKGYYIELLQ